MDSGNSEPLFNSDSCRCRFFPALERSSISSAAVAESLEAILDGTIPNGYRQMRFHSASLAVKDQSATLGDEVRPEIRSPAGIAAGSIAG